MARKRKPAMTKILPVKMPDDLDERLKKAADKLGEGEAVIMRTGLRFYLDLLEAYDYSTAAMTRLMESPSHLESLGSPRITEDAPAYGRRSRHKVTSQGATRNS